jgi:hypothetical protein
MKKKVGYDKYGETGGTAASPEKMAAHARRRLPRLDRSKIYAVTRSGLRIRFNNIGSQQRVSFGTSPGAACFLA